MFYKKIVISIICLFIVAIPYIALCNSVFAVNNYTARMWIDSPKEIDSSFEKMVVSGWYLSNDENAILKILINDKEIPIENITKRKRPDVISAVPGYGGSEINPKPGYAATVDISTFRSGYYILKTQVISRTGEILTEQSRKIYIQSYKGRTYIDEPKQGANIEGTDLIVQGWVMSDDISRNMKIFIDNQEQEIKSTTTRKRPDVISAVPGYGGINTNPEPGYKSIIDISKIKNGKHNLKVQIISGVTGEVLAEDSRQINIEKYKARTYIDSPKESTQIKEKLAVSGWIMSTDANRKINIYLNDEKQKIKEFTTRVRPDVISAVPGYGGINSNPEPGYAAIIDVSNKPAGKYTLKVEIVSSDTNEVLTQDIRHIVIYNKYSFGIDVSKHNGTIDWQKVKNAGVEFSIIRVAFRGYGEAGTLVQDIKFVENMKGAIANGIDVGVYFYSQATNEVEAIEEADMTLRIIKENGFANNITLPIVIDTEESSGRADNISKEQRTNAVKAFCERIKKAGYTPMIYSNPYWIDEKLNMSELSQYDLWLAHYTGTDDPINNPSNYKGDYKIWQYTSTGRVDGINGDVDLNIRY